MKVLAILILLVISTDILWHTEQKKLKMHKNTRAMKQEISKQVPIGSSIKDAQRIMEANGFACTLEDRGSFAEQEDDRPTVVHKNIDFLYCDKETRAWLLCLRRWQVAIVHKNGIVSDIVVSIGLICP